MPSNTKLSSNVTIRKVRCRGGNYKFRALRLDSGNFSWGSEVRTATMRLCLTLLQRELVSPWMLLRAFAVSILLAVCPCSSSCGAYLYVAVGQAVTRKTRVLDVVYNASNNELVCAPLTLSCCAVGSRRPK